ncbi:MAG: hypothetical protein NTY80_03455 [candidate division SR1 bacterium]|nr:hypothetical protein [candidate division SR1 bacterium]
MEKPLILKKTGDYLILIALLWTLILFGYNFPWERINLWILLPFLLGEGGLGFILKKYEILDNKIRGILLMTCGAFGAITAAGNIFFYVIDEWRALIFALILLCIGIYIAKVIKYNKQSD